MAADERGTPALSAQAMIDALGYDAELAKSVVLVYDAGLLPPRSTTRKQQRSRHPFRQIGSLSNDVDIVVAAGPGAPVAAITVAFLAAFGVEQIVAVGTAGHLDTESPTSPPELHYVIDRAESDEGTSAHYSDDLTADRHLVTGLGKWFEGPPRIALTTDVPFRHTPTRLASHRERADVVEMECAALFAAAHHFSIAAAAVLVLSDLFDGNQWSLVADSPARAKALQRAVTVAANVLAEPR